MLTLQDHGQYSQIYQEARIRGIPDCVTERMLEEFRNENWRSPGTFAEMLEVVE